MCGGSVQVSVCSKNRSCSAYHHLGQRLQRGLQLVGGGQSVREVHGSRQQEQGGGDLLVQVELQPLPDKRRHVPSSKPHKTQGEWDLVAVVTWLSCSLSRSSVTPSALIPRTRQAA